MDIWLVDGGPLPSGLHPPSQKYFTENVGDGGRRGRGGRRFRAKIKRPKNISQTFFGIIGGLKIRFPSFLDLNFSVFLNI